MPTDLLAIGKDHPVRSRSLPWYRNSLGNKLSPAARDLFERYSKIPPKDIESHIYELRDSAWDVFPWPCLGEFWFLIFGLSKHPQYSQLVNLLKTTPAPGVPQPTFLDLGTCVGQDLRKLAHDGVPISTLYGSDLFPAFEKVGHALFRDTDRFGPSRFIRGDVFSDDPKDPLFATRGTWSVINIIMFLHLFSMEDQERVCGRLLSEFLRPRAGGVVMGAQTGTIKSGNMELKPPLCEPGEHKVVFRHSRETLMEMWERVTKRIGVKVKVWAEYDQDEIQEREKGRKEDKGWEKKNRFFVGDDERRILFWVERQE